MNTPILTPQDAFSAMLAGKNILCRAIGEMLDFNDLDQFPATIFAKPGYEFCIKIDTIEVAGITFTVPLTLDEVEGDYVLVPKECSDEMAEVIAATARVCGGIAGDVYDAVVKQAMVEVVGMEGK